MHEKLHFRMLLRIACQSLFHLRQVLELPLSHDHLLFHQLLLLESSFCYYYSQPVLVIAILLLFRFSLKHLQPEGRVIVPIGGSASLLRSLSTLKMERCPPASAPCATIISVPFL